MTSPGSTIWRFPLALCLAGVCALAQASERTLVYPTIPGTRTPDRSGESWTIREGVVQPNIPGTRTPKAP